MLYEYIEVASNQFSLSFKKFLWVSRLFFHCFSMLTNPTHLSISSVARAVSMSVQNLRKTYIRKWKLAVSKDARWMPYIDLSECLRVFPDSFKMIWDSKWVDNQNTPTGSNQVANSFYELSEKNRTLETENQLLNERLKIAEIWREQAERREEWARNHIDKLTEENARLLPAPNQKKPSWMTRIFGS